ncbi:hypothetical protein AVW16_08570 [Crenobacter luteus]|uniref:Type II secretion system protein H n=2 Tax=Crenobacter luteus TaxID=1452487 RepID=A0A161R9I5_9NEIS|nr:hypothetical protein AVW16_08570 [Crenobacter luteus]
MRGLTLVELLVAMAVAAIGLAIAIPSFGALSRKARLSDASSDLAASLNYARSEAIRRNQAVHVCALNAKTNLDVQGCLSLKTTPQEYSWNEGVLLYADRPDKAKPGVYESGERIRHVQFKAAVAVSTTSPQLTFNAEGRVDGGQTLLFRLRDLHSDKCLTVRLSAGGRARLLDPEENNCDAS